MASTFFETGRTRQKSWLHTLRVGAMSGLVALALVTSAEGALVVIDQDTTIDAANSFLDDSVSIVDSSGGATTVTMVPGGAVSGFRVSGDSSFEINGGTSTFLSALQDNATLVMRGGTIECSESVCLVIDYDALLQLGDNSSMHIYGGTIAGPIRLDGDATAHFYGRGLALSLFPAGALESNG